MKTIRELCGKSAKRWTMWARVERADIVSANDLTDSGFVPISMAASFLSELCREGYVETVPGAHYQGKESIILYRKREVS